MKIPEAFLRRMKRAIYEWIGSISVKELAGNELLGEHIEKLSKSLRMITA